jgi:hypothetical protein
MKTKSLKLLLLLMATAGLSLACVINLGGPTPEGPAIPISENSADEIQTTIDTARELASSGDPVTFGLSEGQATSLLAIELQKKEDPLLRNPQVYLEDGYVEVYGQAQSGVLAGNLHLTLEIYADDEGNPAFKITQADFGPLPLPEGLLDSLSSIFDEAFTGKLGPLATGIRIDKISVDNGWMEITGRLR